MTKKFCDRCEEPALPTPDTTYQEPYGMAYFGASPRSLPIAGAEPAPTPQQCLIEAQLLFSFRHHSQGFGGPPDLCSSCRLVLVQKLLDQLRETI